MLGRLRGTPVVALAVAVVMLVVITPSSAVGAVSLTWERNWGSNGVSAGLPSGTFNYPRDVAIDKWGNVYVTGGANGDYRVQMFTPNGVFVRSIGTTGSAASYLAEPRTIATDRWGSVYVTEGTPGNRVSVWNPSLYVSELPTAPAHVITGSNLGDLNDVFASNGVAVALDGDVYNSDSTTRLQRFSANGVIRSSWAPSGPVLGVAVSQDDVVYAVTDHSGTGDTDSILSYSPTGSSLGHWGGYGTATGQLSAPYDVGVDGSGMVFALEAASSRIQLFSASGDSLAVASSFGSGAEQLSAPFGIGVGFRRDVCVADEGNSRVSKWTVNVSTTSTTVAGDSRYTTAVEASKRAYPDGAKMVVIATGENWPDALGGAALAGAADAPLLLTRKDSLPAQVAAEIARLGAVGAYILGSEDAVSKAVYDAVDDLMILAPPERLGGKDRYATANLIAAETVERVNVDGGYDGTAFVATGLNFPDALAASPIAAANGWPIYLTGQTGLPSTVRAAMIANGSNHGYILGSTDAVGAAVATELKTAPFLGFTRYGGANRYETSAIIAEEGFDGMGMLWSRPALAVGTNFPDALAGGVLQGSDASVILLTPKDKLDPYAAAALSANRDSIYELRFLGSTDALGNAPRNSAKALLH